MKKNPFILLSFIGLLACQAPTQKVEDNPAKKVGGNCEGCEAIYEYGDKKLLPMDTLPAFQENEPRLKIQGTVFQKDGQTPAEDVILYIYHTNRNGIYQAKNDATGWGKKHGMHRGWVKTGKDGQYTFYTFRPVAYPDNREPEHIHITVKEPTKNEYYLDDYVFTDDPLLTSDYQSKMTNRGGSGIVTPIAGDDFLLVKRDLILGKNIPDYP